MGRLLPASLAAALLLSVEISAASGAAASPPTEAGDPDASLEAAVTVVSRAAVPDPGVTTRVVTREEIERIPARSLPELLQSIPGLDVRRRGVEGVQADIGIRGADHDGTLFLVDGEPVGDPQTNHFSGDLDVPIDAIERIEIFAGAASALYGSGATGGVVNVVTRGARLGRARAQLEGRYVHGTSSLDAGSLRIASKVGDLVAVAVDASRSESSGFRDDTEYQTKSLRLSAVADTGAGPVQLALGYGGKQFGAFAFYGTAYPNQQESARVRTARLSADVSLGGWIVTPSLFYRDHRDDFVLERANPAFYENRSDTASGTARLVARGALPLGTIAFGAESGGESISSISLGDHSRNRQALFAELTRPLSGSEPERGGGRLGLRLDRYDAYGSRVSPLLSFWYSPAAGLKLRASGGSAFRAPTFTDLYYRDPQNVGNPDLSAERAWNAEVGATLERGPFSFDLALFTRHATNLIDFVQSGPSEPYQARNIRTANTSGVEAVAEWRGPRRGLLGRVTLQAAYVFADLSRISEGAGGTLEGRYLLDPLHTKWDLIASGTFPLEITYRSRLSYHARPSFEDGIWLVDARIGRQLLEGEIVEVYLEGENLGNVSYQERPGVPLPSRRIAAGLHLTW